MIIFVILYVSDNPLFLCGKTVEEVQREGYAFYRNHVPEEDMKILTCINQAGFEFFRGIPIEDCHKFTISYNFHLLRTENNDKVLINHQISPLKLSHDGNIWLALCMVSLAPSQEVHMARITSANSNQSWQYSVKTRRWKLCEYIYLSEYEKSVIRPANQGFSVSEIADKIKRSEDSVKGYRKSLFSKLGVTNISEAIAVATHRRLI